MATVVSLTIKKQDVVAWLRGQGKVYLEMAARLESEMADQQPCYHGHMVANGPTPQLIGALMDGRPMRKAEIVQLVGFEPPELENWLSDPAQFEKSSRGWYRYLGEECALLEREQEEVPAV